MDGCIDGRITGGPIVCTEGVRGVVLAVLRDTAGLEVLTVPNLPSPRVYVSGSHVPAIILLTIWDGVIS